MCVFLIDTKIVHKTNCDWTKLNCLRSYLVLTVGLTWVWLKSGWSWGHRFCLKSCNEDYPFELLSIKTWIEMEYISKLTICIRFVCIVLSYSWEWFWICAIKCYLLVCLCFRLQYILVVVVVVVMCVGGYYQQIIWFYFIYLFL